MQFPGAGERLFGWGAMGVDLFFVLSGFVITLSVSRLVSGPQAAWQFIQRRMLRLLPAYYMLLLTFALGGDMSLFHYQDKVDNLISALTFTTVSADNGPFYIDDSGLYGIRWTLNYEIWFYLLMAYSLLRQRWIMLSGLLAATLLLVPLFNGQPLTLEIQGYALGYGMLNLIANPIIWTFAAGVACATAFASIPSSAATRCQSGLDGLAYR